MKTRLLKPIYCALTMLAAATSVHGTATDLATSPLVTSSASSVLPNMLFILDDSGSMDWSYLPDWANDTDPVSSNSYTDIPALYRNSGFNGVAYNPAVNYSPPIFYNSDGTLNTSTYPSQTSANTSGWTTVKNDGYGIQSTSTTDLTSSAYYYVFIPGEYCDSENLRNAPSQTHCTTASAASTTYPYRAPLRWCNSSALTTCQATWISGDYKYPRYPKQAAATITVSGTSSTTVSGITVNSTQILSATTTASTSSSTVATNIVANINACFAAITGNCTVSGYSAHSSGSTVTINPPANAGNITYTPVVTKSGSMTLTAAAFSGYVVPGVNFRRDIVSANDSYPYPGSNTKSSTRSDCAGTTCTYAEEMTNYANWRAYYRTRMQMMKTSASHAFSSIGSNYRVGYSSINNNTGSDFLNLAPFAIAQKINWYLKLFAASPDNSTPLREALSDAGRIYAGKVTTHNGVAVTDPVQYSCQQNFSILSTDGYWNGNAGYQLDGSTAIGNQDGTEPRPYNDGGTTTYSRSTSQLQSSQTTAYENTSQLQKKTTQIQSRTTQIQQRSNATEEVSGQLYQSTSSDSGSSWTDWSATSTCTQDSSGSNRRQCMVGTQQTRTSANSGSSWSGWSNASSCTAYDGLETRTSSNSGSTWTPWAAATSCSTDNSGTNRRQCQTGLNRTECQITQNWTSVSSCAPTRSGSSGTYAYTGNSAARDCRSSTTAWANVSSCTPASPIECQTTDTGWTNASLCTASGPTSGQTVTCQTTDTGWVGVSSCSASSSSGQAVTCQTTTTGPTAVATCSNQTAGSGNSWLQRTCSTTINTAATGVASCTADAPTSANGYLATNCTTVTTGPSSTSSCTAASASASNNYTTTTCTSTSSGGTSNTLADVAEYYYKTDLRTSDCAASGTDVCSNDVPTSGSDGASWQHMTTFTLGLGVTGYMQFSPSYATANSGDYYSVKNGVSADPANGICPWEASGTTCNWPTPASDSQKNIDDLWHAAVNGRGTYFSATSPASLSAGLSSALAGVSARLGASAAATTSNPNVTSGDNFVFSSTFTTQDWAGQLFRQQIDLTTGAVPIFDITDVSTYDWASQAQLDSNTSRVIYTYDASTSNKLKLFTWANLSSSEQAYFNTANISSLSQFCSAGVTCLDSTAQTAAAGTNLLSFIKGDRTNEGVSTDTTKYYRQRAHILGDIVNAEAVYVKSSLYNYADSGYSDFKTANESRQGIVYAAANDGILHAFNASTGVESWAHIPSMVLPNLYKLADKNYSAQHQYYVDGTPIAGDICPNAPSSTCSSSQWKTILVGGLNRGGRGYYALDVTDPASPKALWEFTDTNMGYTYGNPVITKICTTSTVVASVFTCTAYTWVVLVTSGYNNVSPGDGVGRLYILNASTGALIRSISTGTGDTTTPSGLARINSWVENSMSDNSSLRAYGGDMLGNLWRFDLIDNVGPSGYEAERLTTFYSDTAGTARQPITTKPELGSVSGTAVVFVGTGRYLGATDLTDTSLQTFYAVKDPVGSSALTAFSNPRASGSGFVSQTQTTGTCPAGSPTSICTSGQSIRTTTNNTVNFSTNNGWYVDLPDSAERSNTDPTLALGTLAFTTNVPNVSACTAGGYSWTYFLDYRTGAAVSTSTTLVAGKKLGNALATRAVLVRLPNNTVVQLTRMSDGTTVTTNVPIGSSGGVTRRVSWRELVTGQ